MYRKTLLSAGFVAAALAGGWAYAQDGRPAAEPAFIPLTMAQAVTIAEATTNGHVTKARLEGKDARSVYKLKVATDQHETLRVRIAAAGGKVLSSQRDGAQQAD